MANNDLIVFQGRKMSKLTASERESLPTDEFALPAQRKYPVDTENRAVNAKARAKDMMNRGTISKAEYDKICAKADRKLAE